jgi:hypothetical protein
MTRRKRTQGETIPYKKLHMKLKIEQRELTEWFSPDTPVSSTNKTDCHDITVIRLKVALNTIKSNLT